MKNNTHIIYLIGFMGSGKTTMAKYINKTHNIPYIDIDDELSKIDYLTEYNVYKNKTKELFRNNESKMLLNTVNLFFNTGIVSCGGNIILKESNIDFLVNNGFVVWLDVDLTISFSRIKSENKRFGLLKKLKNIDVLKDMYDRRYLLYKKSSDIRIDTTNMNKKDICNNIFNKYIEFNNNL